MNFFQKSALCVLALVAMAEPAHARCGEASFYGMGDGFHGQKTASGERFNTYSLTAAHPYLPFGTRIRVTRGSRAVVVVVNDRGPYVGNRLIDLSYAAFNRIASPDAGVTRVCIARL